jgi:hypothetical protein
VLQRRADRLPAAARAFRCAHAGIAAGFLGAIGYVWWCGLTGRRGPLVHAATTALIAEGALVAANHGDCPLGGLQERLGDTVPLFELVLPPRAARLAVPMLGAVAACGIALTWRNAARTPRMPSLGSAFASALSAGKRTTGRRP